MSDDKKNQGSPTIVKEMSSLTVTEGKDDKNRVSPTPAATSEVPFPMNTPPPIVTIKLNTPPPPIQVPFPLNTPPPSPLGRRRASTDSSTRTTRRSQLVYTSPMIQFQKYRKKPFAAYISDREVLDGLENGTLFKGSLRINQRNFEEAYMDDPEGDAYPDVLIQGVHDRNRALQGDVVVVRIKEKVAAETTLNNMPLMDEGKRPEGPKIGEVVYIAEKKNSRTAVGQLKTMADGNRHWALFSPNDSRMPRLMIPAVQAPNGFFDRPQDFSAFIYVASIIDWPDTAMFARGLLYKQLGNVGEIVPETEGLLLANDVDTRKFSHAALSSLPIEENVGLEHTPYWKIDEKELAYRKDFRDKTIFTIDPKTARDLDDALHITRIADCDGYGTRGWEVGVHIADVSFFLKADSELDKWASNRSNSIYLVHQVIPMLPDELCDQLCSLLPGVDRFAFSVVWKMTDQAEVKDTWFGRTIIRSCAKLAYGLTQEMIDEPTKKYNEDELETTKFYGRELDQVRNSVQNLHRLAQILKKKRVEHGALRLDQPKIKFSLDMEGEGNAATWLPSGVALDKRREANNLVEEFMLKANMAVAERLADEYPQIALLRRHSAPKTKSLRDCVNKCAQLKYPIFSETGGDIAASLLDYEMNPELRYTVHPVLVQFLLKCMQLAEYFCASRAKSLIDYHHYALNVDFYTHFTSPIRRYPDVIVHRLLAAALGYIPMPDYTVEQIDKISRIANERKLAGKLISEESAEMFFGLFISRIKKLEAIGVVIGILDKAFDVLLVKFGITKRVYTNGIKVDVQLLSIVRVMLTSDPKNPIKFMATYMIPESGAKPLTFKEVADYVDQ